MKGKLIIVDGQRGVAGREGNYVINGHVDMRRHGESDDVDYMTVRDEPGVAEVIEVEVPTLPANAKR